MSVDVNLNCVACRHNMCAEHGSEHMAEVQKHLEVQKDKTLFDTSEADAIRRARRRAKSGIRHVHGPQRSGH